MLKENIAIYVLKKKLLYLKVRNWIYVLKDKEGEIYISKNEILM